MSKQLQKLLEMDAGDLVTALQAKGYSFRTLTMATGISSASFSHYIREGEIRRKANEADWRKLAKLAIKEKAI